MMEGIEELTKKHKNEYIWTLFIDLKSAFDSVDHRKLFEKLKEKGIDEELINTIKWLYATTKICVNNKNINIGCGVI